MNLEKMGVFCRKCFSFTFTFQKCSSFFFRVLGRAYTGVVFEKAKIRKIAKMQCFQRPQQLSNEHLW